MQQMTLCPKCGTQNAAGQSYCSICGAPIQQTCPNCSSVIDVSSKFCSQCGAGLGWGMRIKDIQSTLTQTESGLRNLMTQNTNDLRNQFADTSEGLKGMIGQYSETFRTNQMNLNEIAQRIADLIAEEHSLALSKRINKIGTGINALGLAIIGASYVLKDIPMLGIIGLVVVGIGFLAQAASAFIR